MATPDDFINLLRRATDEAWLTPLLNEANSTAVLRALAVMATRVSKAGTNDCNAGSISDAQGGTPGTSIVTLTLDVGGAGGTIPIGTLLVDARGFQYRLVSPVVVPVGPATLTAVAESLRQTNLVNTEDDPGFTFGASIFIRDAANTTPIVITAPNIPYTTGEYVRIMGVTGNTAANGIFRITLLSPNTMSLDGSVGNGVFTGGGSIQGAPVGNGVTPATAVYIVSSTPVLDASVDWLSVLGRERGVVRQQGESTENYRARVRNIPDAVSPFAISDAALTAADAFGISGIQILEPFNLGETPSLKVAHNLGSFSGIFTEEDYFDDPLQELVDLRTSAAYFRIEAALVPDPTDLFLYFDDGYFDDPILGFPDASTLARTINALNAIYQAVDTKRAGGVQFDIYLNAAKRYGNQGTRTSVGMGAVFTLTAPVGKSWRALEALASLSLTDPAPVPGFQYKHEVKFTFTDATTFTTPEYITRRFAASFPNIERGSQPFWRYVLTGVGFPFEKNIASIEFRAQSDGVNAILLRGDVWVLEFS